MCSGRLLHLAVLLAAAMLMAIACGGEEESPAVSATRVATLSATESQPTPLATATTAAPGPTATPTLVPPTAEPPTPGPQSTEPAVTLLVTPWITGRVLNTEGEPLMGATVRVGAQLARTGSNGEFALSGLVTGPQNLSVDGTTASTSEGTYPVFDIHVDIAVDSQIALDRPIYLPLIRDLDSVKVESLANTEVKNATDPGLDQAMVRILSKTAEVDGEVYDGSLSITMVPPNRTPRTLAQELTPSIVITMQPAGVDLTIPAPITLPNADRHDPGAVLSLWSLDHETGKFFVAGVGQVSADGRTVETIQGGVRGSSWHFFVPTVAGDGFSPVDLTDAEVQIILDLVVDLAFVVAGAVNPAGLLGVIVVSAINGARTYAKGNEDGVFTAGEKLNTIVAMIPLPATIGVGIANLTAANGAIKALGDRITSQFNDYLDRVSADPQLGSIYNPAISNLRGAAGLLEAVEPAIESEIAMLSEIESEVTEMLEGFDAQLDQEIARSPELKEAVSRLQENLDLSDNQGAGPSIEELEQTLAMFEDISLDTTVSDASRDFPATHAQLQRLDDVVRMLEESDILDEEATNPFAIITKAAADAEKILQETLDSVSQPVGSSLVQLNCGEESFETNTKPDGSYILSGDIPQGTDCGLLVVDQENGVFASTGVALRASSVTPTVDLVVSRPLESLAFGQTVEGELAITGELDLYAFEMGPDQTVFFDVHPTSDRGLIDLGIFDQNSELFFSTPCIGCGDSGTLVPGKEGKFTIIVGERDADRTGSYSFTLWEVPAPDRIDLTIGDSVGEGVPTAGAGNIESPGAADGYTFSAEPGQKVFLDVKEVTGLTFVDLQLVGPGGELLHEFCLGYGDPGTLALDRGGIYTIKIGDTEDDRTGTYSFQLWDVPPPERFEINIGDVVSDGAPQVGAGNIENPGAEDSYTFNAEAGQVVFFDVQEFFGPTTVDLRLSDRSGALLVDTCLGCGDPGELVLELGGDYTIIVGDSGDDSFGTYSFQLTSP